MQVPLLHHLRNTALAHAGAPTFFQSATDLLGAGDIVMISASDGARILTVTDGARTTALA